MREGTLDVLIHGAGPVGCALALALRRSGMSIGIIHASPAASPTRAASFRPIALSHASRLILERIGAWAALAPTAINAIHVSQAGGFGRTRLDAADAGVPALGYVLEYDALAGALRAHCADLIIAREVPARCIVHAEGVAAEARERRYAQDALVGLVTTAPVAQGMAFERFTAEGPLALLPLADRYALVWSMLPERAGALARASEADFLAALAAAAGSLPGT